MFIDPFFKLWYLVPVLPLKRGMMVTHFVALSDLTPSDFSRLIKLAAALKKNTRTNRSILSNQVLGMIFQKPSLRTRVSFDVAMLQLGGHALYLSPQEIGLGQRESVADIARVLSRYVNCIMARVFEHAHIVELADYSNVPIINGLSDLEHPCQALADLFTVNEHRGKLKGLKLAFLGDANNVARSLMFGCALSGMHFACASPNGYAMDDASLHRAEQIAALTGGSVDMTEDSARAARDADVLYTDVWASMGQESEQALRAAIFPPYQLNALRLGEAKPGALVMHCLPAHRGMEITDELMDGPNSVVFDQAENRMHAQKAVLVEVMEPRTAAKGTSRSKAQRGKKD